MPRAPEFFEQLSGEVLDALQGYAREPGVTVHTMSSKKIAILAARIVVSAGMLAFLIWKINDSRSGHGHGAILPPWSASTAAWLALALVLTFFSVVVSARRWRSVLESLDVEPVPHTSRLVSHNLAGLFVGNVLPSTIGGDVLRVSRLSTDLHSNTPASFASVVLVPPAIVAAFCDRALMTIGIPMQLAETCSVPWTAAALRISRSWGAMPRHIALSRQLAS